MTRCVRFITSSTHIFLPPVNMSTFFTLLVGAVVLAVGHGQDIQMRWCTISTNETSKCNDFKTVAPNVMNNVNFSCVQGSSAEDCMKKIKSGAADLITLDGGQIYVAGKDYGMVPIVGEDYGSGFGTSYYAVAVVKKNTDITFKNLKGKRSCHTGAGKTAGWIVPVGTLLREKIMEQDKTCNPYVSAGKFFSKSCVPRVKLEKYDPKAENLCGLCTDECTEDGKYSNYAGAFKCLEEGNGDVAFIKHTTVRENAANPSDYQYLCVDGNKNNVSDNCYLAKVPSHAVMIKAGSNHNSVYKNFLVKASDSYGVSQNDSNMFQLFNSTKYSGKDLLFKDSTKSLVDVGSKNQFSTWLGNDYMGDLKAIEECPAPTGGTKINKLHSVVAMVSFVVTLLSVTLFK